MQTIIMALYCYLISCLPWPLKVNQLNAAAAKQTTGHDYNLILRNYLQ